MSEDTIIPRDHYNYLWRISWLSLFTSLYAAKQGHYDLAFVPGGIFLTSINYWRNPNYSWRRTLDINYVRLALAYQVYRAYKSQYSSMYYAITTCAVACYPIAIYYYKQNQLWKSVYFHSMIHILGNVSNVILYSDEQLSLPKN